MKSYDEMAVPELEALLREANEALSRKRSTHKKDVRKRVMEMIKGEGLTLADVFPEAAKGAKPRGDEQTADHPLLQAPVVNPNNPDQVWEGKGRKPKWLITALKEAGQM